MYINRAKKAFQEQDSYLEYLKLDLLIISPASASRTSISLLVMKYLVAFVALAVAASQVSAVCPGFNFAIGNQIAVGGDLSHCRSPLDLLHVLR